MTTRIMTLGRAISEARKAKGISQKDLAAAIDKDDGTGQISPQYLNDIEHDRRSPTSDHLIRQFEKALGTEDGYLFFLAGKIPDEMRRKARDPAKVAQAFRAFRKSLS
jgi:transcriptional regulator with XRE-family HTH domain